MTQSNDGSLIHIENLTKLYGAIRAVDDISLDVERGGVLGLLGPNGAGKTTLMRIISGYLRPTEGEVSVGGEDVAEDPESVKKNIGYLPEFSPMYQEMMTYDYLWYVAGLHGVARKERDERIRTMSGICGLGHVMHQSFRELSHGYKQRVGLAHAVIGDPDLLILDEPTSGLDPNQIVKIRSIIKELGRRKTVILSTHLLNEAESTCDRIVIINRGKIVADASPAALRSSVSDLHVVSLSLRQAKYEDLQTLLTAITGVREVKNLYPEQSENEPLDLVEVAVSCSGDLGDAIYRAVKEHDWIVTKFSSERSSLESVFRDLTTASEPGD